MYCRNGALNMCSVNVVLYFSITKLVIWHVFHNILNFHFHVPYLKPSIFDPSCTPLPFVLLTSPTPKSITLSVIHIFTVTCPSIVSIILNTSPNQRNSMQCIAMQYNHDFLL